VSRAWLAAADDISLGTDDVHVWRARLVQPPDELARLGAALAADERDRAARFRFDRDRNAYTAARGALRALIAGYLGCAPDAPVFGYRERGKPYLIAPPSDLQCNVSHSGGYALLAFTRGREIGVDVEQIRPLSDLLALARTSFSPSEYAVLCGLPAEHQLEAFFACWSRKEAFIKATGEGVSQLAEFDVTVSPNEPARLLRLEGESARRSWTMYDLPAIDGHSAALAVEGRAGSITCWDWPAARQSP
jgi:4'-phosphopantetheinyl transferase